MPRGRVKCVYQTDQGFIFWLWVDADSQLDPNRGWGLIDPETVVPFPRLWKPRAVVGVDETGASRSARVGTTSAKLWTGEVSNFSIEGTDGVRHLATVIARLGERLKP